MQENKYSDYQFKDTTKALIRANHFVTPTQIQRECSSGDYGTDQGIGITTV